MNNEEKILEMLGTLVDKVSNLETDMKQVKTDITQIKEDTAVTREATNTMLEWIDEASGVVEVRFPVKKK